MHRILTRQVYKYTNIQIYKDTNLQIYKYANVHYWVWDPKLKVAFPSIPQDFNYWRSLESGIWRSGAWNIQEYEYYKNKLIHYGLGNFYFGSKRNKFPELCDNGIILILDLDRSLKLRYINITYDRIKNKSEINKIKNLEIIF